MAGFAARLRPPGWAQDIMLAAFVTFFQIRGTVLVAPGAEVARLAEPGRAGYALLASSGLALLLRRRWPVPVFAAVATLNAVYYLAGYPDGPGWLALFVAAYTVMVAGDGVRSLRIVAAVIAVLTPVWLLTADLRPLTAAGWVFFRIGAAVMAAALGESFRTRRVLTEQAQERAERAERTREEEARRRVDAERLRIAREVHDTVAHALAVINVHAGVTAHVLDRRPQQARETLMTIERTSAEALHELRVALGMLRDTDDHRLEPVPGLDRIDELTELARRAGLEVTLRVARPPRKLPDAVEHAAYRILQESITNVIRHAGPARVTVRCSYGPDDLRIEVTDDGAGFRADGAGVRAGGAGSGQGLIGMRERCGLLGGELVAGPRPDGGFQVRARIPLEPEPAARR